MKVKKLICMMLAAALSMTMLAGCGGSGSQGGGKSGEEKEVYSLRIATHYNQEHLGYASLTRIEEELESKKLSFDKLVINLDSYELLVDGQRVDTPPKELELLFHLASAPNRVFTRNQLLDEVWGFDYFGDSRTVDVHIKRLREKLEGVSDQWRLKTVWGVGYKFEVGAAN